MTHEEAQHKILEYIEGGLTAVEKSEFEQEVVRNGELVAELKEMQQLEAMLRSQNWLSPHADFTETVMAKAGIEQANHEVAMEKFMDKASKWSPAVTAALIGIFYGTSIYDRMSAAYYNSMEWVVSHTGMTVLQTYPLIGVGILAVFGVAGASLFFMNRRGRVHI